MAQQGPAPFRGRTGGGLSQRSLSAILARVFLPLLALFFTAPAHAQTKPQRIVSMNLCTDEMLMRIVDPSRIASITYLSRQPVNAPLGLDHISAKLPVNHGLAVCCRNRLLQGGLWSDRARASNDWT